METFDNEEEATIHLSSKVENIEQAFGWVVRQLDSKPIKYPNINFTPVSDDDHDEPIYWVHIVGELDSDVTIIPNPRKEGSNG